MLHLQTGVAEPAAVTEAVAEAVDTAVQASEVTDKPAVVEAIVDGAAAPSETATAADTLASTPAAEMPASAVTATADAGATAEEPSPGSAAVNGSSTADLNMTRLFVGCVPFQFSEDDLKAHFEPVRFLKNQTAWPCTSGRAWHKD